MVASHHAYADHPYAQRLVRACLRGVYHVRRTPAADEPTSLASPSTLVGDWRPIPSHSLEHVLIQTVTTADGRRITAFYSAAREAGTLRLNPAASASVRNAFTASSESSAAVLVPSAGSFLSTSAGAVMMWQPISSASITL